jgi:hypothetical protein
VGGKLGDQATLLVEELFGMVGAHPLLQHRELLRVGPDVRQRHLVGAKRAFDGQATHHFGACPALRGAQHDRRPARSHRDARVPFARLALDGPDPLVAPIERRGEGLVHVGWVVPLDKVDLVTVTLEYGADFLV